MSVKRLMDLINFDSPQKMLSIGQPFVGSMVITDSPRKKLYERVQWFDVRKMTFKEASSLANGLALLGDTVMFDCFGQIVMNSVKVVTGSSEGRD